MQVPMELAEKHYSEHEGKPFYDKLISFITSAAVFAMVVEGENVAVSRKLLEAQIKRSSSWYNPRATMV